MCLVCESLNMVAEREEAIPRDDEGGFTDKKEAMRLKFSGFDLNDEELTAISHHAAFLGASWLDEYVDPEGLSEEQASGVERVTSSSFIAGVNIGLELCVLLRKEGRGK